MRKLFNKILVPVDFSKVSDELVNKAIEIAHEYQCSIYLLHVYNEVYLKFNTIIEVHRAVPYTITDNRNEMDYKMNQLVNKIHLLDNQSISIHYGILKGEWLSVINELVEQHQIDLVLIGQKRKSDYKCTMLVDSDKLAEITNIPVITLPVNRELTKLYTIVIPVTDFLPVNKLMYGIYMASIYNTTIKLLGVQNEKTKEKVPYYLQKAFQLLYDNCLIKVQTEIIISKNVAEAVYEFALLKSADLVIVNPGTETRIPGFFSSVFRNIIQRNTSPPVLTISPL